MKNLVILLLLFAGIYTKAQNTNTITGAVTDAKGERLPGAMVFVTNTQPLHRGVSMDDQLPTGSTEKAYLHLDKTLYSAGDTIWFKAYITMGTHQLSTISNVLNVELVNDRDSIKQHLKLLLSNGLCHGGLALSDFMQSGNYRVRAYTNEMRNTGEEFYFDKNIRLINFTTDKKVIPKTTSTAILPVKMPPPKTIFQFFVEGGKYINGLDCKIAFKATTANGKGIAVKGSLIDEQGNRVADLSCGKLGMGYFYLNAEAGKTYKAQITDANGIESKVLLPKADDSGYVLSVSAAGPRHIRAMVQAAGTKDAPSTELTLIASVGGVVCYQGKSKPGNSSFVTTIAKNRFPTGIVQFTLFASSGEPLNERLIFIQNNDQLKLSIKSEKQTYGRQQKVMLQLGATNDENNQPAQGSFSVSVIDETKIPLLDNNSNILSELLLTSDLRGYVENPAYYFEANDQQTTDDLDALMLTQGYRKFSWQTATQHQRLLYPTDTGLTISGRLTLKGKPLPNSKITLYSIDGGFFSLDTLTNDAGQFAFTHLSFPNGIKFVAQCEEKHRDQYKISIDTDRSTAIANKNAAEFAIDSQIDILQFIQNRKQLNAAELSYNYNGKAKLLHDVIIKEKPNENLASPNSVLKSGHADYVITAKQLAEFPSNRVSNHLFGFIPDITYDKNGGLVKNHRLLAVVVDGYKIANIDEENLRSIESIEFKDYTLFVTTKRGIDNSDMTYTETLPGYKNFTPTGFYKTREFYSPQYDNPATNKEIADLRTTIYWNPVLTTDKDGNASFEYFNAGSKGTYKVTVEGIDGEGKLGRAVYRYKVE